jgi:hypothetical protein
MNLPGSKGHTGRPAEDNRTFINVVLLIRGIWEKLLEVVTGDPDYIWLMSVSNGSSIARYT